MWVRKGRCRGSWGRMDHQTEWVLIENILRIHSFMFVCSFIYVLCKVLSKMAILPVSWRFLSLAGPSRNFYFLVFKAHAKCHLCPGFGSVTTTSCHQLWQLVNSCSAFRSQSSITSPKQPPLLWASSVSAPTTPYYCISFSPFMCLPHKRSLDVRFPVVGMLTSQPPEPGSFQAPTLPFQTVAPLSLSLTKTDWAVTKFCPLSPRTHS